MVKEVLQSTQAPLAIGTYSQGIRVGDVVYLSGQIPLLADTQKLIEGGILPQIHQAFRNVQALCQAVGADLKNVVRLTVYLTDLTNFSLVNEVMQEYFSTPYPARAVVGVKQLPKDAQVEIAETIVVLS